MDNARNNPATGVQRSVEQLPLSKFYPTVSTANVFRAEGYGITNTPHFALPTTSVLSQSFGRITATYNPFNYVGASRSNASARILQMALRFSFQSARPESGGPTTSNSRIRRTRFGLVRFPNVRHAAASALQ